MNTRINEIIFMLYELIDKVDNKELIDDIYAIMDKHEALLEYMNTINKEGLVEISDVIAQIELFVDTCDITNEIFPTRMWKESDVCMRNRRAFIDLKDIFRRFSSVR